MGRSLWDVLPTVSDGVEGLYRGVAQTGVPDAYEMSHPARPNVRYEVRVAPEDDGISLYFLDITGRRTSADLLQLTVDVSDRMVGTVSIDAAATALAEMVVPALADWTIVSLLDADGGIRDVHHCDVDEHMRPVLARYVNARLEGGGSGVITEVARTGEPVEMRTNTAAQVASRLCSDVAREAMLELAPESAVGVPMRYGHVVAGVLTMCRGGDRPAITEYELALTLSMCRWAGLAIDNARLYARQEASADHDRTVAQALQRALLTTLPEPDHARLAARYFPAADGDKVGGDWYDAVVQPDGAVTIVIGDVMGHGIGAAAIMGQLRTMVRMLALRRDDPPSAILRDVDRAVRDLHLETLATVTVARLEPVAGDDGRGARTLTWSNAGHPPPVLAHPDGTIEILTGTQLDLLLGLEPERTRTDHVAVLAPGSTLLLYTDGLVEHARQDLDQGIAKLVNAVANHHRRDLESMLDHVLTDVLDDHPTDDVAVLALRLDDLN